MKLPVINRAHAFGLHLLISLIILLGMGFVVMHCWYSDPYFDAEGGWYVMAILALTSLVIGPFLTLIVYRPGKPSLKFDLIVIVILQLSALFYGGNVFYQEKPIFLVYAVDRFTLVSEDDLDLSGLDASLLDAVGQKGPIPVYARMPEDKDEQNKLIDEVLSGKPDLEFRAKHYESLNPMIADILKQSKNIEDYTSEEETARVVRQFVAARGLSISEHAFYPLVGKGKDMLAVMEKSSGQIVGAIDIDPWKQ